MLTFARVIPNKLGQPYKVAFGKQALEALGWDFGDRVVASLAGGVLTLRKSPDGAQVIRSAAGKSGQDAPYVSLAALLAGANDEQTLSRLPLHAETGKKVLTVYLYQPISNEEYRWRRWGSYSLDAAPMQASADPKTRTQNVTVALSPELISRLKTEADALKLTLSAYLAHLAEFADRSNLPTPQAKYSYNSGGLKRVAERAGQSLTAAEMIERNMIPASDEVWLRARLAEGLSYADMARQWGGKPGTYSKWGRKFGIRIK